MKIKLTQPGYETYSGQMGVIFFEEGMTTTDVRAGDAVRLAAQFLCEWENGDSVSVAQSILDHAHTTTNDLPAELTADQALAQETQAFVQVFGNNANPNEVVVESEQIKDGRIYTEAELGEIADDAGIAGLRAIGDPLGVKGNSISGLIAGILAKQAA
ncbi:hypothetical protein [Herbaspirillum huttiense]|uniref:Uncharacterized protein n=1 Tax=Herbaspirillum huttiense subsp. lycopersici TaxID=3074428 RepID=A0ABU2EFV1_9BURK|nr:hypothetical protein [Herbaspirillum huttiense]MDR9847024.1 hypothetical protein [Herbaspirillum huttiense SE1]